MAKRISKTERLERQRKMAEYVRSGHTLRAAAAKFGVSSQTVSNACKELNVPIRKKTASKRGPYAKTFLPAVACLLRGEGISETAEKLGVSRQRVHHIKQRAEAEGLFQAAKAARSRPAESHSPSTDSSPSAPPARPSPPGDEGIHDLTHFQIVGDLIEPDSRPADVARRRQVTLATVLRVRELAKRAGLLKQLRAARKK